MMEKKSKKTEHYKLLNSYFRKKRNVFFKSVLENKAPITYKFEPSTHGNITPTQKDINSFVRKLQYAFVNLREIVNFVNNFFMLYKSDTRSTSLKEKLEYKDCQSDCYSLNVPQIMQFLKETSQELLPFVKNILSSYVTKEVFEETKDFFYFISCRFQCISECYNKKEKFFNDMAMLQIKPGRGKIAWKYLEVLKEILGMLNGDLKYFVKKWESKNDAESNV